MPTASSNTSPASTGRPEPVVRALAWRSVSARKGRALLNGLGIVLGVALFFSVLSLSKTIVSTFDELFSSAYGKIDLTVAAGANGQGSLPESLLGRVQRIDGVADAVPAVSSMMSMVSRGQGAPSQKDQVYVTGSRPDDPDLAGHKLLSGKQDVTGNQIQLDSGWAESHGLTVGETVRFATATGVHRFVVSGIFQLGEGVQFGGQGFAAIDIATARRVFDIPKGYSEIDLTVEDGRSIAAVKHEIEAIVADGTEVNTPSEIADAINSQIQGFNIILYFFAAMSLFVGGFLILNSFNMTVAQRLREIGMLRTLGSSRKLIRRMILIEAVILGVIGALVGILVGLILTKLMVALVSSIGFPMGRIRFPAAAFIVAPILGVFATLLGALRPAIRASRIPPIQAVLVEHRVKPLRLGRRLASGGALTLLGLAGVFVLAASSDTPPPVVMAGALGVIFLFSGVILLGPVLVPTLVRALARPLRIPSPFAARFAADSARSNPTRTAATASGLMIGIALVAAIGTLGSSFIGSISDTIDKELKNDFTIQPRTAQGGPQPMLAEKALTQIRALPATGRATGMRMALLSRGQTKNQMLVSVDPAAQSDFTSPKYSPGAVDDVNAALAAGEATVPQSFAKSQNLRVGQRIEVVGPRQSRKLKIAALVEGAAADAGSIVVSHETFEQLTGIEGYSQILVIAKSPDQRAALGSQIDNLLARDYPAFQSLSNQQVKQQIKDQMNQVFAIFYVIMAIAILVSLLGVVNTLLMSVLERTREIGLLRAIGTTRWQVRRMILAESLLITAAGAVLGVIVGMALGWAFVRGIASVGDGVAFHPPIGVIFGVALLTVIAGVLASLAPARRAARMNVIESLSYE
jgi:putative ABC transport system permease protein